MMQVVAYRIDSFLRLCAYMYILYVRKIIENYILGEQF